MSKRAFWTSNILRFEGFLKRGGPRECSDTRIDRGYKRNSGAATTKEQEILLRNSYARSLRKVANHQSLEIALLHEPKP